MFRAVQKSVFLKFAEEVQVFNLAASCLLSTTKPYQSFAQFSDLPALFFGFCWYIFSKCIVSFKNYCLEAENCEKVFNIKAVSVLSEHGMTFEVYFAKR